MIPGGDTMRYENMTKEQLINQIKLKNQRIAVLETQKQSGDLQLRQSVINNDYLSLNIIRDTIKPRLIEDRINTTYKHLQYIVDFLPDATFVIDNDKVVIAWNKAMETMTGVMKKDIIGKGNYIYAIPFWGEARPILADFILTNDKSIQQRYNNFRKHGDTIYSDHYNETAFNGKGAYLWASASPIYDLHGNIAGAIESIRDITENKRMEDELNKYRGHLETLVSERTNELMEANRKLQQEINERKKAEARLLESQSRYEALLKALPVGLFHNDQHGSCVYVNEQAVAITGFSRDELTGSNWIQAVHPRDREQVKAKFTECMMRKNGIFKMEYRFQRPDGDISWVIGQVVPYHSREALFNGYVGTLHDITQRKHAEEQLRSHQKQINKQLTFSSALNQIAETIIIHNDIQVIFNAMTEILGNILNVDRCLIYETDFARHLATALCERLNPGTIGITPTKATYNLDVFINGAKFMRDSRQYLESHIDDINPHLLGDGSALTLHSQMNIQSMLWFPFSFSDQGYYCLVLNQVTHRREWREEELKFIQSVANLVEIAIQKIHFLNEQDKAKAALLTAHQQLIDIIEFLPDATFVVDRNRTVVAWNKAIEELTGIRKEEILGKGDHAYAVPFYGSARPILIDFVFQEEEEIRDEYLSFTKKENTLYAEIFVPMVYNGKGAYLWGMASPLYDSNGNLIGGIESIRDINDRKRAEIELRLSEERLTAERRRLYSLLDQLPAFVCLQAPDYSFRFANRYFRDHIGNPDHMYCYGIYADRKEPCKKCSTFGVLKTKKPHAWEWSTNKGEIYQVFNYPFHDADGSQLVLVLGIDITEQKLLHRELRESEERYRQLVELSPDVIAVHNEDRILFINKVGANLVGADSPEEIIGLPIKNFIHPDYEENVRERVKQLQITGKAPPDQEKIIRLDGTSVDVEITGALLNYQGEPVIQVVIRDITERKKTEAEMARLGRLNLIGQMAAGIGHEVRNPMTAIRGFLQILESKPECRKYYEYFELMIGELDRANAIITEFLSLAKNKPSGFEKQNLNELVEALVPLVTADAMNSDKYIQLELNDIPDLMLNEKEIRQLILNLTRNGLEAMAPEGCLTIRTYRDREEIILAVQDQGKGITPEAFEKMGTPFFTTKDSGTGLGLAVCYNIAARHKASIQAETGPAGTTFFVRFKMLLENYEE